MKTLKKDLKSLKKQGIQLWMDDAPATAREILKAHQVEEESSYMRDYITDEEGRLVRIEFRKVKNR